MDEDTKSYSQAAKQLGFSVFKQCVNAVEANEIKHYVQDSYNTWANMGYDKSFMNWGLWHKKIDKEYRALNFDFSTLCNVQDIYSQLLLYYLIRPLVKNQFFNKRLLDIGCGNGIGLKLSSELLATQYAVGIDLVNRLASNANTNFHQENKINYIQSDAENLPLDNESVDIVTNLESSHLYPRLEQFFREVERVLSPGGFFCYADIHVDSKQQADRLETFIKTRKNLKIIQKNNITKMVQASIYQRLIINEDAFYKGSKALFDNDEQRLVAELPYVSAARGLSFLPWWQIGFKNPALKQIAKEARSTYWGGKKFFYYYLVQKVK